MAVNSKHYSDPLALELRPITIHRERQQRIVKCKGGSKGNTNTSRFTGKPRFTPSRNETILCLFVGMTKAPKGGHGPHKEGEEYRVGVACQGNVSDGTMNTKKFRALHLCADGWCYEQRNLTQAEFDGLCFSHRRANKTKTDAQYAEYRSEIKGIHEIEFVEYDPEDNMMRRFHSCVDDWAGPGGANNLR